MTEHSDQAVAENPGGAPPPPAKAELERMEDRYKRAVADLDNYRKRVARELEAHLLAGRETVLRDWLEVVDTVERALRSPHEDAEVAALGSVLDQIDSILLREGVRRVGAVTDPFDPTRHEAIEVRVIADLPEHTIVEVIRSGFAIGERTLRPALVVVSRRPESTG